MSLVKNSNDLLVAAAKQCQLDDGTLPKGSDLGDAASFRLDSGFVQARGSTEHPATAPEGTDILQELEKLRAELDSTKVLVAGFSKKTRKKKRLRTSDADAKNEAPPSNRPKTSTPAEYQQDFSTHGRIIARFVGPYVIIEEVIMHDLNVDKTLDYDEENEDEESARLTKSWRIVHQKFPGFHECHSRSTLLVSHLPLAPPPMRPPAMSHLERLKAARAEAAQ
ncbi:hypothetical protein B0H14DRAFT_3483604 [Mycena olivaceomarginata]|nr:hypothetical protein B0H14DRAFT_3483604 [Mycena olivaceomarginata]